MTRGIKNILKVCKRCGEKFGKENPHRAWGLDSNCYNILYNEGRLEEYKKSLFQEDNAEYSIVKKVEIFDENGAIVGWCEQTNMFGEIVPVLCVDGNLYCETRETFKMCGYADAGSLYRLKNSNIGEFEDLIHSAMLHYEGKPMRKRILWSIEACIKACTLAETEKGRQWREVLAKYFASKKKTEIFHREVEVNSNTTSVTPSTGNMELAMRNVFETSFVKAFEKSFQEAFSTIADIIEVEIETKVDKKIEKKVAPLRENVTSLRKLLEEKRKPLPVSVEETPKRSTKESPERTIEEEDMFSEIKRNLEDCVEFILEKHPDAKETQSYGFIYGYLFYNEFDLRKGELRCLENHKLKEALNYSKGLRFFVEHGRIDPVKGKHIKQEYVKSMIRGMFGF